MVASNCFTFFANWLDNKAGNYNSSAFTNAWSQLTVPVKKKSFIANDANLVVLAANANRTVTLLHSFSNIGGSVMRPNDKHVCFIGTNKKAIAVNIDLDSIASVLSTVSPAIRNIVYCETAAEIASIPVPALNVQANFHGCPSFLPAPWLVSAILSTSSNHPLELIVAC